MHVVQVNQVHQLIRFLKKKERLIEEYNTDDNSVNQYFSSVYSFTSKASLFSIPFFIFGLAFLMAIVFNSFEAINLFMSLGYAAMILYGITLFYLYLKFYREKSEIQQDFNTPQYKKSVKLSEADLMFINDIIPEGLMDQFIYECYGKDHNIELESVDTQQKKKISFRNQMTKFRKEIPSKTKTKNNETKETLRSNPAGFSKYSSFLED